ncbi:uncharacterized protein LOC125231604 isoform X2 [Leguminivora glycinivorella]|uniref:uncharacterized protein LOC125231604 isoform X2 n=1 Tax=Leguminivora glycinivorella TaxID=1035111 RepID=UPI00200FB8A8|nr:uncharacterized protein LOC125231604 isoform X2 [Leguminivora glycinivorella]
MFPRIQGLFHSVTEKRQHNDCGENSVTIVTEKKMEDDSSDSSSGEHVEIEDKPLPIVEPAALESSEEGHAAQCACPNCDEVLTRFSECSICLEPLQTRLHRAPHSGHATQARGRLQVRHHDLPHHRQLLLHTLRELAAHLQGTHNIIAVYSQKIKILIENFQTKLKKTACCRTKYKIILLHQKSAFIIKVCIYNYHVRVEVMRRKLGYLADAKSESRKSDYCALVEFQSKALSTKSAILIENENYSKKAEIQWNDVIMKSENDEAITIHVNIGKSDAERKDYAES